MRETLDGVRVTSVRAQQQRQLVVGWATKQLPSSIKLEHVRTRPLWVKSENPLYFVALILLLKK